MKDTKKALLALIAVAITIGWLWQTNRVVTSRAATWNDVLTEAKQGDWVLVHAGFALNVLDEDEAAETWKYLEAADLAEMPTELHKPTEE